MGNRIREREYRRRECDCCKKETEGFSSTIAVATIKQREREFSAKQVRNVEIHFRDRDHIKHGCD
ncbi:hypothetical protein JCGZ_16131 [Jatropha curcas]|uniref:Uncharacterized protein n=1 Tax=Jatropha curcas TaxID=180498 RepID=A0A067K399_JATCU|nr:hypothetical protein JCGZ_16131 [Jatropha curcas]